MLSIGITKFSLPSKVLFVLTNLWSKNSVSWALNTKSELTRNCSRHFEYKSLNGSPENRTISFLNQFLIDIYDQEFKVSSWDYILLALGNFGKPIYKWVDYILIWLLESSNQYFFIKNQNLKLKNVLVTTFFYQKHVKTIKKITNLNCIIFLFFRSCHLSISLIE